MDSGLYSPGGARSSQEEVSVALLNWLSREVMIVSGISFTRPQNVKNLLITRWTLMRTRK